MEVVGFFPSEIKIKRIPKPGYFGISAYSKSTTGGIGAEIAKNGYNTGLTSEEEKYFEEKLGLKPGELNKTSKWWGEVFNIDYTIKLFNTKTTTIFINGPLDQLKYKVLLASTKIANSELERHNNPNVEFYIVNEELQAKAESDKMDMEMQCMELITSLSPDKKRDALRLFGKFNLGDLSETVVKSELYKISKKDPKLFIEVLNDKNLETKMLLEELCEYRIINKKGNYYTNGDDTIASSTDEAIEYLKNIKNQSVVLAMKTRLKKTKKA